MFCVGLCLLHIMTCFINCTLFVLFCQTSALFVASMMLLLLLVLRFGLLLWFPQVLQRFRDSRAKAELQQARSHEQCQAQNASSGRTPQEIGRASCRARVGQ